MKRNNLILILFFIVFSLALPNETKAYSIECVLDRSKCSLLERIEIKAKKLNPLNYLEKRKECLRRKDHADTVAIGKRVYKNCMENN